jgi:hypothetical protein
VNASRSTGAYFVLRTKYPTNINLFLCSDSVASLMSRVPRLGRLFVKRLSMSDCLVMYAYLAYCASDPDIFASISARPNYYVLSPSPRITSRALTQVML